MGCSVVSGNSARHQPEAKEARRSCRIVRARSVPQPGSHCEVVTALPTVRLPPAGIGFPCGLYYSCAALFGSLPVRVRRIILRHPKSSKTLTAPRVRCKYYCVGLTKQTKSRKLAASCSLWTHSHGEAGRSRTVRHGMCWNTYHVSTERYTTHKEDNNDGSSIGYRDFGSRFRGNRLLHAGSRSSCDELEALSGHHSSTVNSRFAVGLPSQSCLCLDTRKTLSPLPID